MIKMHSSVRAIMILIFLVLTATCANSKFTISKTNSYGVAQVDSKELTFDRINMGKLSEYPKNTSMAKEFTLEIGGCNVKLKGYQDWPHASYQIVDSNKYLLDGLTQIKATEGNEIEFSNGYSRVKASCKAKFQPTDDGKFKVYVNLSGEGVPPNLILTSRSASEYEEEPTVEPTLGSVSYLGSVSALGTWGIVGIAVGGALLLLILGGGLICICFIRRRKKRLSLEGRPIASEEGKMVNAKDQKLEKQGIVATEADAKSAYKSCKTAIGKTDQPVSSVNAKRKTGKLDKTVSMKIEEPEKTAQSTSISTQQGRRNESLYMSRFQKSLKENNDTIRNEMVYFPPAQYIEKEKELQGQSSQ